MARSVSRFNERHIIFIVSNKLHIPTGNIKDFEIEKILGEYLSLHPDVSLEDVLKEVLKEKLLTEEETEEVYARQFEYLKGLAIKFPAKSTSP